MQDKTENGVYDALADGLDSGSPGFVVVADAPPAPPVSVPALAPIGIRLAVCYRDELDQKKVQLNLQQPCPLVQSSP